MSSEWALLTARTKLFKTSYIETVTREISGVDRGGEPFSKTVDEKVERSRESHGDANLVRICAVANNKSTYQFHIRLIYGRMSSSYTFEPSIRDDGIVISGPNYHDLDTNEDGLISEEELLQMSAKILRWDGEMRKVTTLPVEGQAS